MGSRRRHRVPHGNVVMAVENLTVPALEAFAKTHGLKLAVDPFHGSTAYEFQKQGDTVACAGCIIGPKESTLYTRILRGRKSEDYEEIRNVPSTALDMGILTEFVTERLA